MGMIYSVQVRNFMTVFFKKRLTALRLVQRLHHGQMRGDGTEPGWHHLDRVSRILEHTLARYEEGTQRERDTIALAGLGHDALEDTDASDKELQAYFGQDGLALIQGMTNRDGDAHTEGYVRQIVASEEGVRLIKFADLYDNCMSVNYGLFTLGTAWTKGFFLPIVTPMIAAVIPTSFTKFSKTAECLKQMVLRAEETLLEGVTRWDTVSKKNSKKSH